MRAITNEDVAAIVTAIRPVIREEVREQLVPVWVRLEEMQAEINQVQDDIARIWQLLDGEWEARWQEVEKIKTHLGITD